MKSSHTAWTVGRYRGAPIRLHWTLLLGALFFSGGELEPGAWVGFAVVVLLHELGHAVLVARYRMQVLAIDLHGFGGECSYSGHATAWQDAVISWGGVLTQAALLAAAVALGMLGLWPRQRLLCGVLSTFVWPNAINIAFNLLPIAPLDGATAWKLFPMLRKRLRLRRLSRAAAALRRRNFN